MLFAAASVLADLQEKGEIEILKKCRAAFREYEKMIDLKNDMMNNLIDDFDKLQKKIDDIEIDNLLKLNFDTDFIDKKTLENDLILLKDKCFYLETIKNCMDIETIQLNLTESQIKRLIKYLELLKGEKEK